MFLKMNPLIPWYNIAHFFVCWIDRRRMDARWLLDESFLASEKENPWDTSPIRPPRFLAVMLLRAIGIRMELWIIKSQNALLDY